jgi:hypothetical protein
MLNMMAAASVPNVKLECDEEDAGTKGVDVPLATGTEANVVAAGVEGAVITPAGADAGAGVPTTS